MMMRNNGVGGPIWAIATMVGYGSILRCFDVASRRGRLYEVYTAIFLKVPYYWGQSTYTFTAVYTQYQFAVQLYGSYW